MNAFEQDLFHYHQENVWLISSWGSYFFTFEVLQMLSVISNNLWNNAPLRLRTLYTLVSFPGLSLSQRSRHTWLVRVIAWLPADLTGSLLNRVHGSLYIRSWKLWFGCEEETKLQYIYQIQIYFIKWKKI